MAARRALHYVFKIGDRNLTMKFFRDVLGMKVLRHEEFEEGCKATCNGPYDGKWSKTMIGYGPEDHHFVCELTYNYGISEYALGNDFLGLYIESSEAIKNAQSIGWPLVKEGNYWLAEAPGGYKFYLIDRSPADQTDAVKQIALASSNISSSISYWCDLLGMKLFTKTDSQVAVGYDGSQVKLLLQNIGGSVDHAKAFGRLAFSCPDSDLKLIENAVKLAQQKIITPYVSLDTPGKATVQVVIIADPDGHEICFVGDEVFRELSQVDPTANQLLNEAMQKDKSLEWFAKTGGKAVA